MLSKVPGRFPRSKTRIVLLILIVVVLYQLYQFDSPATPTTNPRSLAGDDIPTTCEGLEGLDDLFVILRTGTSEAPKKLPAHFATTLRCIKNFAIYSDYDEEIAGHRIHDALDQINPLIKENHPDFEYYNEMQDRGGRNAFSSNQIAAWSSAKNTMAGRDSPGWKLDKWKFLPIADKAFSTQPRAKWYIFIEADTYMLWKTLLTWLSKFDARKPWYLGQQMQIGDVIFAYGGAGFAVSQPAMKMLVEHRRANLDYYDEFTAGHWAGDCVLGKAMLDAGVPLHWSFPLLSAEQPADMDYNTDFGGADNTPWCYYAVSYHHFPPEEYPLFEEFERKWNSKHNRPLRHRDVYRNYIEPNIRPGRPDWDNLSDQEQPSAHSFTECYSVCKSKPECLQYSVSDGVCRTSSILKLGRASKSASSGWMMGRIDEFTRQMDSQCIGRDWQLP
ncbi:hypothetical protein F4780DRAFT_446254 [Xylariomycetidae sp. FL0641]|nr:hypothetical protein F4780DRAFT_446254 [Xylariomycetidae sp. FL0641]